MDDFRSSSNVPDIDQFIDRAAISGYQQITLPNGRVIAGRDRMPTADLVYPMDLNGKTVLDVGCYYGFFLHEAVRRGALRAVGIEMDPERFEIANTLAPLWEGKVGIKQGMLEDVALDEKFDVVLFLNVLHHVKDPIEAMKKLASLCRGTLVVEFRQLHDPQFVEEGFHGATEIDDKGLTSFRRQARRARRGIEAPLMELISRRVPVVGVGAVEYHRSYFFTQAAFRNMFVIHNRIFESVEFRPSVRRGQVIAFCKCSPES